MFSVSKTLVFCGDMYKCMCACFLHNKVTCMYTWKLVLQSKLRKQQTALLALTSSMHAFILHAIIEEYFMAHWIRTKPTYICIHSHTEIVIMIYKFSYITTTIIIEISISAHSSLLLLKLHLVIVHMILHGSKCAYWGVKYRGMA